jgi:hypothetical protein
VVAQRQSAGLQIIFSIFLGLMVTAFIGIGVYTFYPMPEPGFQKKIESLNRQQEQIRSFKAETALTADERARLQTIQSEIDRTQDQLNAAMEVWGRNTSIILIACATLTMVLSLIRREELPVISNGLLLGGVFTMIYSVGIIIATGASMARFAVMTVALIITLALGYLRFVRGRKAKTGPALVTAETGAAVAGIEDRLEALERRMDDAATALGHRV